MFDKLEIDYLLSSWKNKFMQRYAKSNNNNLDETFLSECIKRSYQKVNEKVNDSKRYETLLREYNWTKVEYEKYNDGNLVLYNELEYMYYDNDENTIDSWIDFIGDKLIECEEEFIDIIDKDMSIYVSELYKQKYPNAIFIDNDK